LSERARVTVFGCHKDAETLAVLLNKETFEGVLVSDDAAVYQGFSTAQKCWAHLLRKAIALTLRQPERTRYRQFLDELLAIYRAGKAIAADQALNAATRKERVEQLITRVMTTTTNAIAEHEDPADAAERAFQNLSQEIVKLLANNELFTYAIDPEVDGTNNAGERGLRLPAQDRLVGRTSKSLRGARTRTVVHSVLDSLRASLPSGTLTAVMTELNQWQQDGLSCFRRLASELKLPALKLPENIKSLLDQLVPLPVAAPNTC
jgi:transposase